MNLVADIGNSLTKIAVFDGEVIMEVVRTPSISHETVRPLFNSYDINAIIISSVAREEELYKQIFQSPEFHFFSECLIAASLHYSVQVA
ncbi:MAG: hypothetical protein R2727_06790 [Bacteroidales bacterium]